MKNIGFGRIAATAIAAALALIWNNITATGESLSPTPAGEYRHGLGSGLDGAIARSRGCAG